MRQKLAAEEEARRQHGRHDSAATIRAAVSRLSYLSPLLLRNRTCRHRGDLTAETCSSSTWRMCACRRSCPSRARTTTGWAFASPPSNSRTETRRYGARFERSRRHGTLDADLRLKGALKKRTDYHDSFSTSGVTTLTCANKGCAFSGHISVDFLWKVVQTDNNLGLKCRWAFLGKDPRLGLRTSDLRSGLTFEQAKSHLKQGLVTGRQYHVSRPSLPTGRSSVQAIGRHADPLAVPMSDLYIHLGTCRRSIMERRRDLPRAHLQPSREGDT